MIKYYCDGCGKELSPWSCEYGQVMNVTVNIETGDSHCPVSGGKVEFCSAKCAMKFLESMLKEENKWLDVWRKGYILGTAPTVSKKKGRAP